MSWILTYQLPTTAGLLTNLHLCLCPDACSLLYPLAVSESQPERWSLWSVCNWHLRRVRDGDLVSSFYTRTSCFHSYIQLLKALSFSPVSIFGFFNKKSGNCGCLTISGSSILRYTLWKQILSSQRFPEISSTLLVIRKMQAQSARNILPSHWDDLSNDKSWKRLAKM